MEIFEPFDLVVVPFPFTDREAVKRRPALVLSSPEFQSSCGHVVLAMVTTARFSSWASDIALQDWKAAGLPKASLVRAKVFTLDSRFIVRKLGTLTARDRKRAAAAFAAVLKPLN